jgi:DNA-binding NarL/FixJ family response regulator
MRALDLVSEAVVVSDARTGKRYHNSPAQRLLGKLRDHGVEHFDDLIADQTAHDGVSSVVMPVSQSAPGDLELSVQSIVAEDDAATTISFLTLRTPGVYKIPEIYSRSLSSREQDVAALVIDGLQDNDIARRLNISQHTAKQYLKSVYRKLGVGSRVELTRLILIRALDDARA